MPGILYSSPLLGILQFSVLNCKGIQAQVIAYSSHFDRNCRDLYTEIISLLRYVTTRKLPTEHSSLGYFLMMWFGTMEMS